MIKRTLCLLAVLSCFCVTTFADEEPAPQQPKIRLAVYGDNGAGGWKRFPPLVENDPTIEMEVLNGQQIRDGALDKFDLIILPGGSGKGQGASLGPDGVEKVKQFVASGKGFIGICAGAYFPIQQGFLNAQTKDPRWQRGVTMLKIEFSELGLKTFGDKYKGLQEIKYGNGPVMNINVFPDRPKVEVLAWYRTETAENGTPEGIQINSPAMLLTTYGKGTMLILSPHPEQTPELHGLMMEMIRFIAQKSKDACGEK